MRLCFPRALLFKTLSSDGNSAWTMAEVTIFVGHNLLCRLCLRQDRSWPTWLDSQSQANRALMAARRAESSSEADKAAAVAQRRIEPGSRTCTVNRL